MIIKDNMANMCAKVTSTYMEFTLAFGPKPEFSFSFKYHYYFYFFADLSRFHCDIGCSLFLSGDHALGI